MGLEPLDHGQAALTATGLPGWEIVPRTSVAEHTWDAVVDGSDDGWLWHLHRFQDVLATWPTRTDRSVAVVDRSGEVACVLPLHDVTQRLRGIRLSALDCFGGPCFAAELDLASQAHIRAQLGGELRRIARRGRAAQVTASLPPLAPNSPRAVVNPLLELGFEDRSDASWVVPLGPDIDSVWKGVQSRTRRYIKAARREGVEVRSATPQDLDAYYALHVETTDRTGASPHPRAYFEAIWRELVPAGLADGYVVEHEDRVVAACNVARYKNGVVYWTAASNDGGRKVHANDLLLWEVIRRSAEAGYAAVELGDVHATPDASAKHRTISRFKSKFAGETRPIHRGRMTVAGPLGRMRLQAIEAAIRWRMRRSAT